jgi:hypothetical protein
VENEANLGELRWRFLCQNWNTEIGGIAFRDWLKDLDPDLEAAVDKAIAISGRSRVRSRGNAPVEINFK